MNTRKMNTKKLLSAVFSVVLACAILPSLARASEQDQLTKVTFDQPVEIPGQVLPAGTYWFLRDRDNIDVVRVYSPDWKTLYATELSVSAEVLEPVGDTTFTFAERESPRPAALVKWFYPGETIGHEFLYRKQEQRELAQDKQQTVVAPDGAVQMHSGS
jgi:hypothetical protein